LNRVTKPLTPPIQLRDGWMTVVRNYPWSPQFCLNRLRKPYMIRWLVYVQIEALGARIVGRVTIDECRWRQGVDPVAHKLLCVEIAHCDTPSMSRNGLDALYQLVAMEPSVDPPLAMLARAADDAGSQDAGPITSIQKEGAEANVVQVVLIRMPHDFTVRAPRVQRQ